jgi:hypothetical protein
MKHCSVDPKAHHDFVPRQHAMSSADSLRLEGTKTAIAFRNCVGARGHLFAIGALWRDRQIPASRQELGSNCRAA